MNRYKNKNSGSSSANAKLGLPHIIAVKAGLPRSKAGGFTLIELLVVISIIGLLASVVLVSLSSARIKTRNSRRVSDINQISKAMELFFNSNFSYPTSNSGISAATLGPISGSSAACGATAGCVNNLIPTFMLKVPVAPVPPDNSSSIDCGAAYGGGIANDYQIAGSGAVNTHKNYTITFCISAQVGALPPGIHTLTNGGIQ